MRKPEYRRMYAYNRALLPNPVLAELESGVETLEQAMDKSGLSMGYPGWNMLYYSCLCSLRPEGFNLIVETGTNLGLSTICLAQALADSGFSGKVHTVELDPATRDKALANLERAGLSRLVVSHLGDSLEVLASAAIPPGTLAFCLLDGNHEKDHVVREFELILPRLDHASPVFFDNTYHLGDGDCAVNEALEVISGRHGGNLVNFPNVSWWAPGQAIWQKAPFAPDWDGQEQG